MDEKRLIEFDEDKHIYKVDGVEVPSVTTILSYVTAGHYGAINPGILQQAALKGTLVHEWTQMIDLDCPPEEIDEALGGYLVAYLAFLRDYDCEWEWIEHKFYCPGFGGYCGTIDRYGTIDGEKAVIDIKTTSSPTKANYISYCAQTSAYANAMPLGIDGVKRYDLFLKSDGTYRLVDCEEYENKHGFDGFDVFVACKSLYDYIGGIK